MIFIYPLSIKLSLPFFPFISGNYVSVVMLKGPIYKLQDSFLRGKSQFLISGQDYDYHALYPSNPNVM